MSSVIVSPEEQLYLQIIEDINKPTLRGKEAGLTTRLHAAQIEIASSLLKDKKDTLFIQCGRKMGKTELVCYLLWRHALLNPGSACYYVAPEASHGRKLIWDDRRLQRFLGTDSDKYLKSERNMEMKITFNNNSFIQVIGSENWSVANGLTPSFVVYDEFKVFHPKWHIEMNPNRLAKKAPLVIIGTPP